MRLSMVSRMSRANEREFWDIFFHQNVMHLNCMFVQSKCIEWQSFDTMYEYDGSRLGLERCLKNDPSNSLETNTYSPDYDIDAF